MKKLNHPTFNNPPVREVVLGVFFNPLTGVTNAHFGKYWEQHSDLWKTARDQPSIPFRLEEFDDAPAFGTLGLQISSDPSCRTQLFNSDESRLLQLQKEGLFYNWKKTGQELYPRFEPLYEEFENNLESYKKFITQETSIAISPVQWEVTYVNSIPRGGLWDDLTHWEEIIQGPFGTPFTTQDLSIESIASNWCYVVGENDARLRVSITHDRQDTPDNLIINLSTRGPVKGTVAEGIEIGHATIVNFFKDLTTEKAHQHWELDTHEN